MVLCFCFRSILEKEGPRSLFRGLGPNLVGVAPSRYNEFNVNRSHVSGSFSFSSVTTFFPFFYFILKSQQKVSVLVILPVGS